MKRVSIEGLIFLKREREKVNAFQQKFDQLLIEAIDEVLGSLGESVKNHVYIQLENDFSISKKELPHKIRVFSSFLFRTFGSSANNLEIRFMKTLYKKINADQHFKHKLITIEEIDLSFADYVNALRECLEISRY